MTRPKILHVGGTLYWVIRTRNPDSMVLKDADSTPTVAVRKNGASVGDSVTVTKRSATTGIYDCSYNPAGEVEGDEFTIEESATVTGTTTGSATYANSWEFTILALERGTDSGATSAQALDIQSRLPASLDAGNMRSSVQNIPAIADAVWDEAYADHNLAGSFGKLLNTIRKANLAIEGEVTNAITPTTLTFSSNISATTSAYAHAVLLFVSGPLTGENSPIISYNNTNGVFVLEEALTAVPSNGDEFVVIAGSHVHAIADIQSGLATSAGVTAGFTEIKGTGWSSGTDTLEKIAESSGGGGTSIMVTPVVAQTPVRVVGSNISTFIGDLSTIRIGVFSGSDPVDLTAFGDLEVCVQQKNGTDLDFVEMADLTIDGDDSNYISWEPSGPSVADVTRGKWSLRKASNKQVIAYGAWIVEDAALEDVGS
jgi:hypothetical protein